VQIFFVSATANSWQVGNRTHKYYFTFTVVELVTKTAEWENYRGKRCCRRLHVSHAR
jgi:hypothetical protein